MKDTASVLIEKADLLLKGDLPGHPFRGNQWTGGGIVRDGTSHARANVGGELGANQEWYKGGQFIALTDMPKGEQSKLAVMAKGKVEVEPYKWEEPRLGLHPLKDIMQFGAHTILDTETKQASVNPAMHTDYGKETYGDQHPAFIKSIQDKVDKWNTGERWHDIVADPKSATKKDVALFVAKKAPLPPVLLERAKELMPKIKWERWKGEQS